MENEGGSNLTKYPNIFYLDSDFYTNNIDTLDFKDIIGDLGMNNEDQVRNISKININYINEIIKICQTIIKNLEIKYFSRNSLLKNNLIEIKKFGITNIQDNNNIIKKFLLKLFLKNIFDNNNISYLKYFFQVIELNKKYVEDVKEVLNENEDWDDDEDIEDINKYFKLLSKLIIIMNLCNYDVDYDLKNISKMNEIKDRKLQKKLKKIYIFIPNFSKNGKVKVEGVYIQKYI